MKKIKGIILSLLVVFAGFILVACGGSGAEADLGTEDNPVKLGVVGEDNQVWDFVIEKLQDEGVYVELVQFSDYSQPNNALYEGEIHLNSFQHQIFLDNYNEEKGSDLTPIGNTVIASLGIYSNEYSDVSEIPDGSEITIPNDPTNGGRSLVLLQTAGLIELDPDAGNLPTRDDITSNPKNLVITPVDASQTARSLSDVAAAIVNSGHAKDAGLSVVEDAIFREPVDENSQPYINIIVARPDETELEIYQRIVDAYQQEDTAALIEEIYKGGNIPAW